MEKPLGIKYFLSINNNKFIKSKKAILRQYVDMNQYKKEQKILIIKKLINLLITRQIYLRISDKSLK